MNIIRQISTVMKPAYRKSKKSLPHTEQRPRGSSPENESRLSVRKSGPMDRLLSADWNALTVKGLSHLAIIISGMLIVFFVIDRVNKPMGFMTNEFHKRITFVLSLLAIYLAIRSIAAQRRRERAEYRRRIHAEQERKAARESLRHSAADQSAHADRQVEPSAEFRDSQSNEATDVQIPDRKEE